MRLRSDPFREFDRMASQLFADTRAPRAMPMDALVTERTQGAYSRQCSSGKASTSTGSKPPTRMACST